MLERQIFWKIIFVIIMVFLVALRPNAGYGLLIHGVSRSHSTTHHIRKGTSGRVASTWQHTTLSSDRHPCPGGIRTHNLTRRATAYPHLRPHGYWNWPVIIIMILYHSVTLY